MRRKAEKKEETKKEFTLQASLKTLVGYLKWIVVAVVVVILCSGITFIQADEVAIVMRFGKIVGSTPQKQILEPGIHFNFPYIIDKVVRVPVKKVQEVTINELYSIRNASDIVSEGYVLTGDNNVLILRAVIRYRISDPVKYAVMIADAAKCIKDITINSIIMEVAGMNVDDALSREKKELAENVVIRTQAVADEVNLGVEFTNIEFVALDPPLEVKPEFDLVTSTYVNNETIMQEALSYANTIVTEGTAERDSMIQKAKSYKAERVAQAKSDVAQFYGVIEEFNNNPAVVTERLYREKVENILSNIGTLRFLPSGSENDTIVIP